MLDQQGQPIRTPAQAESFATSIVEHAKTRTVDQNGITKQALIAEIKMVANFSNKQADKHCGHPIRRTIQEQPKPYLCHRSNGTQLQSFCRKFCPGLRLDAAVPTSGGRDAYRKAKGKDTISSREYLFDLENNIELGSASLNVLSYNLLEQVDNEVSREYCVISA